MTWLTHHQEPFRLSDHVPAERVHLDARDLDVRGSARARPSRTDRRATPRSCPAPHTVAESPAPGTAATRRAGCGEPAGRNGWSVGPRRPGSGTRGRGPVAGPHGRQRGRGSPQWCSPKPGRRSPKPGRRSPKPGRRSPKPGRSGPGRVRHARRAGPASGAVPAFHQVHPPHGTRPAPRARWPTSCLLSCRGRRPGVGRACILPRSPAGASGACAGVIPAAAMPADRPSGSFGSARAISGRLLPTVDVPGAVWPLRRTESIRTPAGCCPIGRGRIRA
jgi:hypothetical protein